MGVEALPLQDLDDELQAVLLDEEKVGDVGAQEEDGDPFSCQGGRDVPDPTPRPRISVLSVAGGTARVVLLDLQCDPGVLRDLNLNLCVAVVLLLLLLLLLPPSAQPSLLFG